MKVDAYVVTSSVEVVSLPSLCDIKELMTYLFPIEVNEIDTQQCAKLKQGTYYPERPWHFPKPEPCQRVLSYVMTLDYSL